MLALSGVYTVMMIMNVSTSFEGNFRNSSMYFSMFTENTCKCTLVKTVSMVSNGLGCTTTAALESNRLLLTPDVSKVNSGLFQCHCCQPQLVRVQQRCVTTGLKQINLIQDRQALLKLAKIVGGGQQMTCSGASLTGPSNIKGLCDGCVFHV